MNRSLTIIGLIFFGSLMAIYSASARPIPRHPVQSSIAQNCQADCLQRTAQIGRPAPVQACQIRCGAVAEFNRAPSATRGVRRPAIALPVMPAAPNGYSVVYAARSPSSGFGMVIGNTDRLAAYRTAEQLCRAAGPDCRMIGEFTSMCGAVAQGIQRSRNALFITSDPNTFVVTSTSQGSAGNRADAERDAMAECSSVDRQGTCRIVATQCGRRVI